MKKLITVAGGILIVSAIALTYLTAGASVGDVIYVGGQQASGLLSGANKTKLVNAVRAVWPTVVVGNIDRLECTTVQEPESATVFGEDGQPQSAPTGNTLLKKKCRAVEEYVPTDEEYVQAAIDGTSAVTLSGDMARTLAETTFLPADHSEFDTFTNAVWGKPADAVWAFRCWRSNKADKTKVDCQRVDIQTATPAQFRMLHQACATSPNSCQITSIIGRVK